MNDIINQLKISYSNWDTFLAEQSPRQLLVNYDDVHRMLDVFSKTAVSLEVITEAFETKTPAGLMYMQQWLKFLNDFLNINKGIPDSIMPQVAYTIYKRHIFLTLADLKLIFDFILESRYGTFYGSIDTQRIISSFAEYSQERKAAEIKIKERELEAMKKDKDKKYTPPPPGFFEKIERELTQRYK